MIEQPSSVEPDVVEAPGSEPSPREDLWLTYRVQAHQAACASNLTLASLIPLLEGRTDGTMDDVFRHLAALAMATRELGEACSGLEALNTTSGVA